MAAVAGEIFCPGVDGTDAAETEPLDQVLEKIHFPSRRLEQSELKFGAHDLNRKTRKSAAAPHVDRRRIEGAGVFDRTKKYEWLHEVASLYRFAVRERRQAGTRACLNELPVVEIKGFELPR